jgi:hypothetical protein
MAEKKTGHGLSADKQAPPKPDQPKPDPPKQPPRDTRDSPAPNPDGEPAEGGTKTPS